MTIMAGEGMIMLVLEHAETKIVCVRYVNAIIKAKESLRVDGPAWVFGRSCGERDRGHRI